MNSGGVDQIISALELIHSPKSTNEARREAQLFLDDVKKQNESPLWGYELSLPNQNAVVRHFGLTLLQHSVSTKWYEYDNDTKAALKNWVIDLSNKLLENDPHYLKEKLAFVWVAIAKRCWGSYLLVDGKASFDELVQGWGSMDRDLWQLWNLNLQSRELSLTIFRTLFEDIYLLDDPITLKRNEPLSISCTNLIFPIELFNQIYEENINLKETKALEQGWYIIWKQYLDESINNNDYRAARKTLETFKSCLSWPSTEILTLTDILSSLLKSLVCQDISIKILTVDCLHILFTRNFNREEDKIQILGRILHPNGIQLLSEVYHSISIDPDDIDDEKYMFLKKFTEMIVGLTDHSYLSDEIEIDIEGLQNLILSTTNENSPTISGISLNYWGLLLRETVISPSLFNKLVKLMDVAASKLINFSDLNEDEIPQKFISFDFNSKNESFAYLGVYKKLIDDIIRLATCSKPELGINWLNHRLEDFFNSNVGQEVLNSPHLDYHSMVFALGVSQFEIIEACIKGLLRWKICYENLDYDEHLKNYTAKIVELLNKLLKLNAKDPVILKKFVQCLVQFTPMLEKNEIFKIIERILLLSTSRAPENLISNTSDSNSEEILGLFKDLRTTCGTELNRIGFILPDQLTEILDDLENVFNSFLPKLAPTEAITFKSFLLVVSQRTSISNKPERFHKIVDSELSAWNDPTTVKGLSDLHWFMEGLGIVQIAEYFKSRNIEPSSDLLSIPMDQKGMELKSQLKDKWAALFPARPTRILIQYSIEKLPKDSDNFKNLVKLWRPIVTPIIPHILQLLYQIQAYHNPANWKELPEIVQSFVSHTTKERFWQVGVSLQSRDTFLEENEKAARTLRDFADSLGHTIRYTREYVFYSIASITELDDTFYSIPNIAELLWKAATGENEGITLHSWKHMINVMIRSVIKNCPTNHVPTFMLQFLPALFSSYDKLITTYWEKIFISDTTTTPEGDEQLSDEMMEEHLLRQLTQVIIRSIIDCVGQHSLKKPLTETQVEIRKLVFTDFTILAPFLTLLCHLLIIKDSKCSYNVILILKNILNEIMLKNEDVDVFLCENLTKSLIHILTTKLYEDSYPDASLMLTGLYMSMRTRGLYIIKIMKDYLPRATDEHFMELDRALHDAKNQRDQKNAINIFIYRSKKIDDELQNDDNKIKKERAQLIEKVIRRKKNETNILNDPSLDNGGAFGNLFEDQ